MCASVTRVAQTRNTALGTDVICFRNDDEVAAAARCVSAAAGACDLASRGVSGGRWTHFWVDWVLGRLQRWNRAVCDMAAPHVRARCCVGVGVLWFQLVVVPSCGSCAVLLVVTRSLHVVGDANAVL